MLEGELILAHVVGHSFQDQLERRDGLKLEEAGVGLQVVLFLGALPFLEVFIFVVCVRPIVLNRGRQLAFDCKVAINVAGCHALHHVLQMCLYRQTHSHGFEEDALPDMIELACMEEN